MRHRRAGHRRSILATRACGELVAWPAGFAGSPISLGNALLRYCRVGPGSAQACIRIRAHRTASRDSLVKTDDSRSAARKSGAIVADTTSAACEPAASAATMVGSIVHMTAECLLAAVPPAVLEYR